MPHCRGLWLTMRVDGVSHRGLLRWSGPPSLVELERVLEKQIGHVIRNVGDVEINLEATRISTIAVAASGNLGRPRITGANT